MYDHKDLSGNGWFTHGHERHQEDSVKIKISIGDQQLIRDYLRSKHARHCPPGIAKKNNGCLPPGIAKKYALGQPLPPGVGKKLPGDLLSRLHPVPGHMYVQVDKDILLIAEATRHVVDAITLLSAVN